MENRVLVRNHNRNRNRRIGDEDDYDYDYDYNMTRKLLHGADIVVVFEMMSGERALEGVGSRAFGYARFP